MLRIMVPTPRATVITALAAFSALSANEASALVISGITDPATAGDQLTAAVQSTNSGITVVGPPTFAGNTSIPQQATYSDFNLEPSVVGNPVLSLPDGILLTSGSANLPATNTVNQFNPDFPGTGGDADLSALSGESTEDVNSIEFSFTLDDTSAKAIEAQFVFGTDEFPTQSVDDIFGFFVDGVNFAFFPSGDLVANNNASNFIDNPLGAGLYDIEYNGLSPVISVVALLDPTITTHTVKIAIADTEDDIYDSGVFIGGLKAVGGEGGDGTIDVSEPALLSMIGVGLIGLCMAGRRRRGLLSSETPYQKGSGPKPRHMQPLPHRHRLDRPQTSSNGPEPVSQARSATS